jgi:membrane associated rhomboid family serine protease
LENKLCFHLYYKLFFPFLSLPLNINKNPYIPVYSHFAHIGAPVSGWLWLWGVWSKKAEGTPMTEWWLC